MNVDSIKNGVVIDHIKAGQAMKLYHLLELDKLECTVAIIKNVSSKRMGKKDIIKIDTKMDLDLDIIGYVDPEITVNVIENSQLVEKKRIQLPVLLRDVVRCKNPRCITSVEAVPQIFELRDAGTRLYRCRYCEAKAPEQ
ncbi:MAG: aspartate carbamoyltransferase regulatory subunit [Clostridia bacterium]|nr:aspartate carbamoyltransferase regulatory subunit [Clostridia bacterium]